MPLIRQEIEPPFLYGSSQPEILIVGWGSTYGVMREVVDVLSKGKNIAMLHFSEIYPFPLTEKNPSPTPFLKGRGQGGGWNLII